MKLIPVSIAVFYRFQNNILEVWTQKREDDGPFHGLWEFPGGKVEKGETPLQAVIREINEEVGISVNSQAGSLMGIYPNYYNDRVILLNVFIFSDPCCLELKGQWLKVGRDRMSSVYMGQIPGPNHQIIDDLFKSFCSDLEV
jgi:8-oxo-dGTP diphosphatase